MVIGIDAVASGFRSQCLWSKLRTAVNPSTTGQPSLTISSTFRYRWAYIGDHGAILWRWHTHQILMRKGAKLLEIVAVKEQENTKSNTAANGLNKWLEGEHSILTFNSYLADTDIHIHIHLISNRLTNASNKNINKHHALRLNLSSD